MFYNVFSLADTPTPNMWSCTKVYRIHLVCKLFSYTNFIFIFCEFF